MIDFLENEELQRRVDYSFGDHSGVLGGVPNAYMKKALISNDEFRNEVSKAVIADKKRMTLFIDNVRLYKRPIEYSDWLHKKPISTQDRAWLNTFADEDLLALCEHYRGVMNFVIYTAFEDTPLDEHIQTRIPINVLAIYAANAVIVGGKIHPFPHGIERKMYPGYDHHLILEEMIDSPIQPEKLLFVAHREDTGERTEIGNMFRDKPWATVTHLPYQEYLTEMKKHKFVLCPSGNGIESARNWETLYMRRVPIFKKHPYLIEMFKDFPCVFVDDFEFISEKMLQEIDFVFQEAQKTDIKRLTLTHWMR